MKIVAFVLYITLTGFSFNLQPRIAYAAETAKTGISNEISKDNEKNALSKKKSVDAVQYDVIFKKTREVLKQSNRKDQVRISKNVSESVLIEYLHQNPEKINADRKELLAIVRKESKVQTDPTKHLRLIPPVGLPGYSDLKIFVSHPYYMGDQLVKESNLVKEWIHFLNQAETRIMLNVFDFDLMEVAIALVVKAKAGVAVTIGIDNETIEERPEVSKIYQYLKKNGVNAVAVNSVNLNHQKMAIIDWDQPAKAKVLFSSGNLTQSCLGFEGDLKEIPKELRPERSVPNANHILTMNSWLIANLAHNELTKTMDEKYKYRGAQYPVLGSYQITGPGVDPQTFEAYPENSVIISFSPGGGNRNINRNIIGHFIKSSNGPIRMIQFAFSSEDVTEALLEKAQHQGEKFNFLSVGDTPFAMQNWSQFLKLSGLKRVKNKAREDEFIQLNDLPFQDVLGKTTYTKLRSKIRIAPPYYSNGKVKINGKFYPVSAKIHHKVLSAGPFSVLGTSFNFSKNAQKNNEQILVFKNKELAMTVDGMTKWLADKSIRSVFEEAGRRNSLVKKPEHLLHTFNVTTAIDEETTGDSQESKQAQP